MNIVLLLKLIFVIGIIIFSFSHFQVRYEFILIISCLIVVFVLKKESVSISLNDNFKNKLIKKKDIYLNFENNFFIIKKSIADIKIKKSGTTLYNNNDILHYPSFESNLLDVGDIILSSDTTLFSNFIKYLTSSDINHIASIIYFKIDSNNNWKKKNFNFKIPDDYYLVFPIVIHSSVYDKVLDLYSYFRFKKGSNIHIFRCKYGDDSLRKQFASLTELFTIDLQYDFDFYVEYVLFSIFKFIFDIFSTIIDLGFYNNNKLFYSFYTTLISNVDSEKINTSSELLYDINNKYIELESTIDKKLAKKIKKQIEKKSAKLLNYSKNKRGFVCSSVIYFIYYKFGIDLFNNNSFDTDPIKYSYTITPADFGKIINDNRFDYICTISENN